MLTHLQAHFLLSKSGILSVFGVKKEKSRECLVVSC
ncbi:hypothetical protein MNBD_GAMMA10-856 [hydrothermal vent metagenome]|uniref:Uncharacterized protein n=1 Tax=hydrothermal vent metagenome TaxID=652676 RepID=A0A3B0Y1H0_9ZZZZ